ncbi:MAG: formylglycine-generating enzyme family protein [Sediminibacterium sp.]|nr:formylglycine-generating enzyme family protein [Sediminibacterium sp.]
MFKNFFAVIFCFIVIGASAQQTSVNFEKYEQKLPVSNLRFAMVPIPAGQFKMGSIIASPKINTDETPQKEITLDAFWMSATEVTRDVFDVFLKDETTSQNSDVDAITRPSPQYVDLTWGMGKEGGYPANSMSQYAALMFCKWLYKQTGIFYRLPTEAEWEYASRAGATTPYYFGTDPNLLTKYAWFQKNSTNKYQKVAQKLPNAWGLYDMLGNLMEWTTDHYLPGRYASIELSNPMVAPTQGVYPKVLRGGSYLSDANTCRNGKRIKSDPIWNRRDPQIPKSKWWLTEATDVGIRLVRPFQQPTPEQAQQFYTTYLIK